MGPPKIASTKMTMTVIVDPMALKNGSIVVSFLQAGNLHRRVKQSVIEFTEDSGRLNRATIQLPFYRPAVAKDTFLEQKKTSEKENTLHCRYPS